MFLQPHRRTGLKGIRDIMKSSIGVMQGRLTPRRNRAIQFFPFDNWENEFHEAKAIGLHEIEFIFDFDNFEKNPLWSEKGCAAIRKVRKTTEVDINFICADYFMAKPFFRCSAIQEDENVQILKRLIDIASRLGVKGIEIPIVDNSSIKTPEERNATVKVLKEVLPDLEKGNLFLGLETDLNPAEFKALLKQIGHPLIRANYDTGNSSGIGYDPAEEINSYGNLIGNVHIKDRLLGDGTVELGKGSAQFDVFFSALAKVGYAGGFILQAARGEDGNEKEWIKGQISFLERYISKYLN
jgi:hexulose-6-phosphate isomerase